MAYSAQDFRPGDRVRFREWEDMKREFGLVEGGRSINCKYTFSLSMKHLCGTEATLHELDFAGDPSFIDFESGGDTAWAYSFDMIEPANPVKPIEFSEEDFHKLIGG